VSLRDEKLVGRCPPLFFKMSPKMSEMSLDKKLIPQVSLRQGEAISELGLSFPQMS